MSKDTSHHAMVWICRLPPFDKDVRVGVPIVVVVIVVVVDLWPGGTIARRQLWPMS